MSLRLAGELPQRVRAEVQANCLEVGLSGRRKEDGIENLAEAWRNRCYPSESSQAEPAHFQWR